MAWIEGLSSSNRLLLDLSKILTQANKATDGTVDETKNWQLVYPRPFDLTAVVGEAMTVDGTDNTLYRGANTNWFQHKAPVVYETISTTTAVVDSSGYTVDYVLGTVKFDAAPTGTITVDYTHVTNESLETGLAKIGQHGSVILKTKTSPGTADSTTDPFNTDPDLQVTELEMFMQIEKPQFLINPETGQLATTFSGVGPIENHFHLNTRIFDKYDYANQIPTAEVIDPATNLVTVEGANVSEWSKYSWYKDFREFLVDELDSDPGSENISDGIVYTHIETPGLYGEVAIQYWISTNNDRIAMVLMGEPAINYDNYLTSFMYVGKIDSFTGSVNDTAGNFALTTGSSSIPAAAKPNRDPITENVVFSAAPIEATRTSGYSNNSSAHRVSYKVVAVNADGIGAPSTEVETYYTYTYSAAHSQSNEATKWDNFQVTFSSIPANATHVRIYRKDLSVNPSTGVAPAGNDTTWFMIDELTRDAALAAVWINPASTDGGQDATKPVPISNFNPDEAGVIRDTITGSVVQVKFPKTWGVNTATGVNDVTMYKTRSGVYYQRHQASFITPEQFMQKDAFNPSRWTNKFHLSPLYIVHGYDGYRGWLKDVVVVDDSSIVHLDELIVDKGTANEQIYKYFRLSAPFSMMQNSANANYGIGIKKV